MFALVILSADIDIDLSDTAVENDTLGDRAEFDTRPASVDVETLCIVSARSLPPNSMSLAFAILSVETDILFPLPFVEKPTDAENDGRDTFKLLLFNSSRLIEQFMD